jgi:HlyD family secretion protein
MAKKSNSPSKVIWIIGSVLVVLVVVAAIASKMGAFGNRTEGIEVEVAEAGIRSVTQVVTSSGKVQPEVEVKISPDVSGEIVELRVREGDRVNRGDLLVRIKQDDYLSLVEQSKANVLQSKAAQAQRLADYLNARLEAERQQGLFDAGAISDSELQRAKTQFDVASAALEAAKYSVQSSEARLQETQDRLNKTTIYAPMSGTVSVLAVEAGERVVGTSQMQGTEMMRIALLEQMELEVDVNENDVVNISVGDSATIEIDAYPDQQFRGQVTEIANSARVLGQGTQQQVTNFPVKVRVLDVHNVLTPEGGVSTAEVTPASKAAPQFRPGMSGTVDISTRTVTNAVTVPIQAVTVRDMAQLERERKRKEARGKKADADESTMDESESAEDEKKADMTGLEEDLREVVFVVDADNKAKLVVVETGITDESYMVITSGLVGGEKVITGPYRVVSRTLTPDQKVREKKDDIFASTR